MPLRFLKLVMKAKDLPEAMIVGRVIVGIAGVLVLAPVVSSLRNPEALSVTDYAGAAVLAAVGGWLVYVAVVGRQ